MHQGLPLAPKEPQEGHAAGSNLHHLQSLAQEQLQQTVSLCTGTVPLDALHQQQEHAEVCPVSPWSPLGARGEPSSKGSSNCAGQKDRAL